MQYLVIFSLPARLCEKKLISSDTCCCGVLDDASRKLRVTDGPEIPFCNLSGVDSLSWGPAGWKVFVSSILGLQWELRGEEKTHLLEFPVHKSELSERN